MENIKYNEEDLKDHDAIAAVVKDSRGRILMQDHVKYGFYTIPIGKAKNGQTPENGVKEELLEECGIEIKRMKKIVKKEYVYERNGKNIKLTCHIFEVLDYGGKIVNAEPHKHRKQEFLALDEIKKLPYLSDATVLYLETLGFERKSRI